MGTQNLSRMFNPASIAVISAGDEYNRVGQTLVRNLIEGGFKGAVYPVNTGHTGVMDLPAAKNIRDIQDIVDLAVVAAPIGQVHKIIDACAEKGTAGAVVISGGGKETGEQGARIERQIKTVADQSGMRIIGPNCIGIAHPPMNLNASHMPGCPGKGRVAFLSQSGSVCAAVMDLAKKENLGFSHFVSLGSMLDVDFADMLDYLSQERNVDSIIMYMENMTRNRHFMSAARAVSRIKPIICLKSGRSAAGARAASFHTGALAGQDAVYDIAFERAGILRVDTFEQLFDFTRILARQQRPSGRRLAIVTNAGGPGVMAVDALSSFGIEPAVFSAQTIDALETALEKPWSKTNPVDVLADASCVQISRAVSIAAQAPEVDGILLIHSPVDHFAPADLAQDLADRISSLFCPVFTVWLGGASMDSARQILNEKEILTYDTPEKAVRAFVGLYRHSRNIDMLNEIPVRRDINLKINHEQAESIITSRLKNDRCVLGEADAKTLLEAYGIPVSRTEPAQTQSPDFELFFRCQTGCPVRPGHYIRHGRCHVRHLPGLRTDPAAFKFRPGRPYHPSHKNRQGIKRAWSIQRRGPGACGNPFNSFKPAGYRFSPDLRSRNKPCGGHQWPAYGHEGLHSPGLPAGRRTGPPCHKPLPGLAGADVHHPGERTGADPSGKARRRRTHAGFFSRAVFPDRISAFLFAT